MRLNAKTVQVFLTLLGAVAAGAGCTQTGLTHPTRSAVEQLLLSTAADRAWAHLGVSELSGKKVYVEEKYFDSYDKQYALGALRDAVSSNGALLVAKEGDADVILEPRSGALSIDANESLVGWPKTPLPIPFAGVVETPEIALFKSEKQFATAKFAFLSFDQKTRQHLLSSGPLVGQANIKYFKILGLIKFTRTTIPEKKQ